MDADSDAGEQRRPSSHGMTRDDYHAKEKAAFLAGAGADDESADVEEPAEAEKPKPKKVIGVRTDEDDAEDEDVEDTEEPAETAVKAKPAETDDEDADDEDDDEDERDTEDDDEDELAAKAKDDPELAKRLAAVRRTEQRHREAMQRERASFERERSEWQSQSKQVSEAQKHFDGLVSRVRYNPTAVLRALGLTDDDLEGAAQHVAAHSKAAGVTPQHRAAAERAMREREAADKAASAEDRVAKLERTIAERDQQAAADRELDRYFRRVTRKAGDDSPRVKALVAGDPAAARAELEKTAFELAQKLGRLPKSKELIAAHERKIARQLKRYGVESAKPAAGKPKPGTIEKPGDKPTVKPKVEPAGINGATILPTRVTIPTREEMVAELEGLS